jgi:Ankyrin repeats (3 copies)
VALRNVGIDGGGIPPGRAAADGWLPLHFAAGVAPLDWIRRLVAGYPASSRMKTSDGSLSIHCAVQSGRPNDVARFFLGQWPDSVREGTSDGCLPVHLAVEHHCSLETIQSLTEQPSSGGLIPLNHAARSGASEDILQFLAEQLPRSIRQKSNDGWLPLHFAAYVSSSLDMHTSNPLLRGCGLHRSESQRTAAF